MSIINEYPIHVTILCEDGTIFEADTKNTARYLNRVRRIIKEDGCGRMVKVEFKYQPHYQGQ